MRTAPLLVATMGAVLLAASAASAPVATDPKTIVLQPADLPAGFKRTSGRYVSNAQANRQSLVKRNFARLGRINGYEADYERDAFRGILQLEATASTYKTSEGAHESFAISARAAEAIREPRYRRLAVGKIGDQARLYKATVTEDGIKFDVFSLGWRSGAVNSGLLAVAPAGTAKPAAVVALARKQQARIAAG